MLTRIGLVLRRWRRSYGLRWEFVALAILGVSLAWTLSRLGQPETPPLPAPVALAASTPQPRPTAAPTTARPVATATPTLPPPPTPVAIATLPVAPYPGGAVYTLTPAANAVGWVSENDARFNNFGDYNIYAGIFDGNEHVGAFQIDLSPIPPGAPILYADLTLAGLSDRFRGDQGTWTVEILPQELDQGWTLLTFGDLAGKVGATIDLRPTLAAKDIALGQYNTLVFDAIPLQALAQRTLSGHISFRVLGPTGGGNNLVAWDSGYGSRSRGRAPLLRVVAGPAPDKLPDTPTPNYIIITSTPTPENVVTQAAQAATATYQAMMEGTPTRLPRNWVTPIIVVPTETPANAATAEWHIEMATAQAYFGTPTLYPPNVWTATPIPPTPEPTWTRAPVYILVAPVASPANVVTAAALARAATAQAERFGTPTPGARLVPIRVITNTPTPGNEATADWQIRVATAEAFLFGTSVPSSWLQTATPIPPWLAVTAVTPTPTVGTPTPGPIPDDAYGKIAFLSDRSGGGPVVLVMDPDGGNVRRPSEPSFYWRALENDLYSPDRVHRLFVRSGKAETGYKVKGVEYSVSQPNSEIWVANQPDGWQWNLITGPRITYDPVWSPDGVHIAFVSQESGNDDIYIVNRNTKQETRVTNNTWEWDKHPSYSPDGRQLVFWSNRETQRKQIWIVNTDGSAPRNLSNNEFNDWDPVWIK